VRCDADPAGARGTLNLATLARAARVVFGAGALVVLTALLTGAFASPFLLLVLLWLVAIAATPFRSRWFPIAVITVSILAASEIVTGRWRMTHAAGAIVLLGGAAAASLWTERRDAAVTARLDRLDRILEETAHPAGASAELDSARRLATLDRALEALCLRARARRVVLWSADAERDEASARAVAGDGPPRVDVRLSTSPLGWLLRESETLGFEAAPPIATAPGTVAAYLLARDGPRGTLLTVQFDEGAGMSPAELQPHVAPLRELLALHDERIGAAGARARVTLLLDALRHIPATLEPQAFGATLLADAMRLCDATGSALAIWQDEAGRVIAVAGSSGGPSAGATFEPAESELAMAARANATLVRDEREIRARTLPLVARGETWPDRPRALAVLPLSTNTAVVGALAVWSTERDRIDPAAIGFLETLAPFAAVQLQRALEFRRVQETAERDALTHLANRRVFDRELGAEAARWDRYRRPLALLTLDVDHFKSVNDRFGHEAGDAVLRAVATTLDSAVRDTDLAARVGGEEFAVLLPESTLDAANEAAERLRRDVERLAVQWNGSPILVRISVGVSACPECVGHPRELPRSADAALYQAKHEGRNRVVPAPRAG